MERTRKLPLDGYICYSFGDFIERCGSSRRFCIALPKCKLCYWGGSLFLCREKCSKSFWKSLSEKHKNKAEWIIDLDLHIFLLLLLLPLARFFPIACKERVNSATCKLRDKSSVVTSTPFTISLLWTKLLLQVFSFWYVFFFNLNFISNWY